jgi:hypothetical protein
MGRSATQSAARADVFLAVIASAAKQSSFFSLLVEMDYFAEPVIGRIRATRWLAIPG